MEAEQDRRTGLHGTWVPHDGPGRFQATRLQWVERDSKSNRTILFHSGTQLIINDFALPVVTPHYEEFYRSL